MPKYKISICGTTALRLLCVRGVQAPYSTIQEIYESGLYSGYIKDRLTYFIERAKSEDPSANPCPDIYTREQNIRLRDEILRVMDSLQLDALIYPT